MPMQTVTVKLDVPVPTIGQHCDVTLRCTRRSAPYVLDVHYAAVYDRTRAAWHTTADYSLTGAALAAVLAFIPPVRS